ncbi:VOC family protein [Propylenella binzhouense]|uniref:VOC family protein n=1 Tax=Propylenella binzhouense TaxID=2555902 RepID=A0A964T4T5_9HYPH|nr:VOC family protein [Propylenella binzhouense]MYZ48518.1 VOC family protein [Propylenella binzhouense]
MSKLTPCLWFDGNAEEAAEFYVSVMPDSRIDRIMRAPSDYPAGKAESAMGVEFTVAGAQFMALNGGPAFTFTPAVSFFIACEDQAEIDRIWDALSDGGTPMQCGWITDRYGVTWQIVPRKMAEMMHDPDRDRSRRVFEAMMKMVKLDLPALERAYRGEA